MTNLKPCPFCGCDAELCCGPGLGTDSCRGYTLYASCSECGAKSPGLWQEKRPEPNDQSWKDTADEWNHRPSEPDLENCGVAYCEHYPEGLPVCSRCREESTLAHDKACAELAEARAEIENLKWHISSEKAKAEAALELNDRALELVNEARAEIKLKNEELDMFLAEQQAMGEIIESKDKQFAERTRQRDAYKKALEMAEDELMTARADAEHWKSECNALQRMVHEARAEIEKQDTLLEKCLSLLKQQKERGE